jgi:uncharacterized protein YodC (DUF2158 family)
MNKERKFTTGTQVRLKSGGPIMTIRDYVSKDGNVQCNWFYNNESLGWTVQTSKVELDGINF